MKKWNCIASGIVALLLTTAMLPAASFADFISGSTGADGALTVSANTQLQIPESGVLNYTTVTVNSGVTLTFKKNTKNTPVTILASGDVMINGTISVNGGDAAIYQPAGSGGPGGFDGGIGGWYNSNGYRGMGPGGANGSSAGGYGGTFTYGNDGQLPMIGGSGGGGGKGCSAYLGGSGGGGGGAILIASSGTITVNGSLTANGGNGGRNGGGVNYTTCDVAGGGGGGSGGAIRLIATTISGNGTISATGGVRTSNIGACGLDGNNGGIGRIRLEAWYFNRTMPTNPQTTSNTQKWNPTAIGPAVLPSLAITSIGGAAVPAVPKGNSLVPDVSLPANMANPVSVVVSASNIPVGTNVTVKSLSSIGGVINTSPATPLSGSDTSSTATVSVNLAVGYPTVLTASVTYTAVAANGLPLYAEGERVDKIRVDTSVNGKSMITYILESGREIPQKKS